jgi:hypothetical protein
MCALSSGGPDPAGKQPPVSIRRPESIAAVRFPIAIVVVDLTRCFCVAKTFVVSVCLDRLTVSDSDHP